MTHASLFSGIGGFDLAASWLGWQNIFQCEKDPFCQSALKYHFPETILYDDIKETDFTKHRGSIDIVSGGFPCQPFSLAGRRKKGTADDRYLWPEMLRAIHEIQPAWVVAENVYGLVTMQHGMVFERVCADLESAGYGVQPFIIPACAVNAPHRRDRLWIVAHNPNARVEGLQFGRENGVCEFETSTYTNSTPTKCALSTRRNVFAGEDKFITADPESTGQQTRIEGQEEAQFGRRNERAIVPADWQYFPTQSPVCSRDDGLSVEALRCRLRELSNGILGEDEIDKILSAAYQKLRRNAIKAYGNAIVPQVAYQIFKAIELTYKN